MNTRAALRLCLLVLVASLAPAAEPQTAGEWNSAATFKGASGDLRGAIADRDRAIALEPDNWFYYAPRAQDKRDLGDLAGAIADYTRIIALVPDDKRRATYYGKRGSTKSQAGDHAGALEDFDQALKLEESSVTYNNRALARDQAGDKTGAIQDMDKAVSMQPDNPGYLLNRAELRGKYGNLTGAVQDFDRAAEVAPKDYDVYARRGEFRRAQGDLEGAASDYTRTLEGGEEYADSYLSRAMIRQAQGNWEAAAADYETAVKAMEFDTNWPVPYREISLRQLGRGTSPDDLAKLTVGWDDGWIKVIVQFLAGTIAEPDLLARASQVTGSRGPKIQSLVLYFAGMVRLQSGDVATARKYLEQCLTLEPPDSIEAMLVRAELARLATTSPEAPAK